MVADGGEYVQSPGVFLSLTSGHAIVILHTEVSRIYEVTYTLIEVLFYAVPVQFMGVKAY